MKGFLPCILFLFLSVQHLYAYTTEDCIGCHQTGSEKSTLQMNPEEYNRSVHAGDITCQDCHERVIDNQHITFKGSGSVNCGQCHDQKNRHGFGSEGGTRPHCYSCHTRHDILKGDHRESSVHPERLEKTCGACHPAQIGEVGFLAWLASLKVRSHGKQDLGCSYDEKDCLGCHQGKAAHGEKAVLNDRSCPKCHFPSHGRAPLMGTIHPSSGAGSSPWTAFSKGLYGLGAILILIGGFGFYIRKFSHKIPEGKRK